MFNYGTFTYLHNNMYMYCFFFKDKFLQIDTYIGQTMYNVHKMIYLVQNKKSLSWLLDQPFHSQAFNLRPLDNFFLLKSDFFKNIMKTLIFIKGHIRSYNYDPFILNNSLFLKYCFAVNYILKSSILYLESNTMNKHINISYNQVQI